ncbi:membrane protein insertion efficiency factor YidD [Candidatus Uhrbacteria bacterium]|nr:membrane protein insertion efficiency factor YidD [Candidatus Uhrbacteria bacterium]
MFQYIILHFTLGIIWIYQQTISLDHGPLRRLTGMPRCKFHPSCSEYAKGALLKHGIIRGTWRTAWRLLRCNPFSPGGVDEP